MTVHKITLYKMTHTLTNICQSTVINNDVNGIKKYRIVEITKVMLKKIQTRKLSTIFMNKVQNFDILLCFLQIIKANALSLP